MSMVVYMLERGGLYYSPIGWVKSLEGAMKWHGEADAKVALGHMRRDTPALVAGAEIVGKAIEGTMERPKIAESSYNPWGLR